ncbi:MAG: pilus assembly protein N-terminal domain-containing protein [Myxococcota bacterium]
MTRLPTAMLVVALLPHPAAAQTRITELTMFVGEQRVVDAGEIASYSEGAPGVVQVKIPRDASKIVITAVQAGRTSLLLLYRGDRQETWLITVHTRPPDSVKRELADLLAGVPGIAIRQVGPRLIVEGRLPSEAHVKRAQEVARQYPEQVVCLAEVDPMRLERKVNVKLDVHFVEFSRREGYSFGTRWPAQLLGRGEQALSFSYDLASRTTTAATYSITSSALPALDLLSYWGWAKILKQSTLITTNGAKARYLVGGEINVPIAGVGGGALQKIPFGTDVTVTPRFDRDSGRVDLEIDAEASELSEGVGDVPGRTMSSVHTLVHLEMGQAVMLSGIKARTARETRSGWPLLRRIPLLGYLFRSDTSAETEVEGAVFITPTVLPAVGDADRSRLKKLIERYQAFEGEL